MCNQCVKTGVDGEFSHLLKHRGTPCCRQCPCRVRHHNVPRFYQRDFDLLMPKLRAELQNLVANEASPDEVRRCMSAVVKEYLECKGGKNG